MIPRVLAAGTTVMEERKRGIVIDDVDYAKK
jgi:hypothetical protein